MNIDEQLDSILLPITYTGGGLDPYGAPEEEEILNNPTFVEAKSALKKLIIEARVDQITIDSETYSLELDVKENLVIAIREQLLQELEGKSL